jgi:murein DD-endopeptidase MepM/ murein hydrolase activator NlpD
MLRWLAGLLLLALVVAGGAYVVAGRGAPPTLSIDKPDRPVGQTSDLQVTAGAPAGTLTSLTISLEQNGKTTSLFTLEAPQSANVAQSDPTHVRVTRPFGKQAVPELQQGSARIVVSATRKSLLNLRTLSASTAKEVQIRLEPPRVSIVSTHHYVNHGGSEMVVYRASPPDVASGVRVGDVEYAGFPAAGAGVTGADPSTRVAFFALLHDQDLKTPIEVFARDQAGNEARASFIDNVFEKPYKRSRIDVDDRFFGRVVPEIIQHSPELNMQPPTGDLLPGFLKVNGDLRRMNSDRIITVTANTSPTLFLRGPFVQLGNSQVEASFADHRTYVYKGKDVDQQVHLGFDLAVTARVPVHAANDGKVLNASWLGIFGNCVILDHGMGVASLYGHLSSLDVNVGDTVKKGQVLGRSGMTGMAGGDHLHFTMLVGGRPVNPVEWWDAHWIADRVERKIREASSAGSTAAAGAMP